jgi:hypothetical protein
MPEVILQAIAKKEKLDLNCCFISNNNFDNCVIQAISAESAFFGVNVSFINTIFNGEAHFEFTSFVGRTIFNDATFSGKADFGL